MSVLIIVFLTAVAALFSGVFEQGKFARYIGIFGLIIALYVSFLPEASFFEQYRHMYDYSANTRIVYKNIYRHNTVTFLPGRILHQQSQKPPVRIVCIDAFCSLWRNYPFRIPKLSDFIFRSRDSFNSFVCNGGSEQNRSKIKRSFNQICLNGCICNRLSVVWYCIYLRKYRTFDLYKIQEFTITNPKNIMLILGVILMLCAMSFKVALAPFHMWSPDVYAGSPSLITAFMASVVKISGFFALFRLMTIGFSGVTAEWINILGVFLSSLYCLPCNGSCTNQCKKNVGVFVSFSMQVISVWFLWNEYSFYLYLSFLSICLLIGNSWSFHVFNLGRKDQKRNFFWSVKGLAKTEPLLAVVATISLLSMREFL